MAINGTVQATGEFAPTSTGDTYAILDARYMRDGLRNVNLVSDLDNITEDRRVAGMIVGVGGDSGFPTYYTLGPKGGGWTYTMSDWSQSFIPNNVTGGTYDINTGVVTYTNASGGTFQVTGFTSGMTDSYTTDAYLSGNTMVFDNNVQGSNFYNVDLTPIIFTGNTSGDCFSDFYVSNIHSCSPLYINPLDEGNIYFGGNSGFTVDLITSANTAIGINAAEPGYAVHVGNGDVYIQQGSLGVGESPDQTQRLRVTTSDLNGASSTAIRVDMSYQAAGLPSPAINSFNGIQIRSVPAKTFTGITQQWGIMTNLTSSVSATGHHTVVGGRFRAASTNAYNYGIQIEDGTEAAGKVLVCQPTSLYGQKGLANWGTVSVSGVTSDSFVTGGTIVNDTLILDRNDSLSAITVNLSAYTSYWSAGTGTNSVVSKNQSHTANGNNSIAGGGMNHTASGSYSAVIGGYGNIASAINSSTLGGYENVASGYYSSVVGGYWNTGSTNTSVVVGGRNNNSAGLYSAIIGGKFNSALTFTSSIIGGNNNVVNGPNGSSILGGGYNTVNGENSGIVGGTNNVVSGNRSVIIGGYNITGTTDNTVYVPNLNIGTIGSGTSVINLGLDSNGFVVTGTTSSSISKYNITTGFTASVPLTITHNLGTTDIIVQLKDSTGQLIIPNVVDNYQTNSVDIEVSNTDTYRVIIIG